MWLIFILSILLSIAFVLAKLTIGYTEPIFLASVRLIGAGVALLAYYFSRNGFKLHIKKQDWILFAQVAIVGLFVFSVLDAWSIQYLSSIKASFMYNLMPFVSALLSYWYFSEVMTPKKWLGLLIGFIGFVPLLLVQSEGAGSFTGIAAKLPLAELISLAAMTSYVYGLIKIRILVRDRGYSPLLVSGLGMLTAGIAAFFVSWHVEGWMPFVQPLRFWSYAIMLIITGNIALYNLYAYLLKRYTATLIALVLQLSPIITAGLGALFLSEPILLVFIFAAAVIPFGLLLFYKEEVRQGYIK